MVMKMGGLKRKEGFTLVEVSLVLGIAGLIFLMMFIALPALQRAERDTERREDITQLLNDIKKYQNNNRGALPGLSESGDAEIVVNWGSIPANASATSWAGFYRDYLGEGFVDPDGTNYALVINRCDGSVAGGDCTGKGKAAINSAYAGTFPNNHNLYIITQAGCADSESKGATAVSSTRKLAVLYKLEGGGVYCADV